MTWRTYCPGEHPLVIVGAGFPLAVLDSPPPSTASLLEDTAKKYPDVFPIIKRLTDGPLAIYDALTPNRNLNHVWTHIEDFGKTLLLQYDEIRRAYSNMGSLRITTLVQRLLSLMSPSSFIITMLGVEIKRMIALHYDGNLQRTLLSNSNLSDLLSRQFKQMTWLSLNYDIVLEFLIDTLAPTEWKYCFRELFAAPLPFQRIDKHVLVKPHGSVNVWFKTVWGNSPTHSLDFANPNNLLDTCQHNEIGCDFLPQNKLYEEYRPWLIGYLPDFMKDEHNSPGVFADCAHDLCKANLSYAALSLYRATSVYVLGYSMPYEDQWIWNRFAALPQKDFPVYVASKSQTDGIVRRFRKIGFVNAVELDDNGQI